MKDYYKREKNPLACRQNVICGEKYRITVLTDSLLRLEYSEQGKFEDRATQVVENRNFPAIEFKVERHSGGILLRTEVLQLVYNEQEFTGYGLSIEVKDKKTSLQKTWHFGETIEDLGGTARTLDNVNGAEVELDHGIISKSGYAVLDDSQSLVLDSNDWIAPGEEHRKDIYFFGYGHDYKRALKDFYFLCGKIPMLPRYALGNWWSRYYKYSEESYLELMDTFQEKGIPLSVAVLDMDWHLVDIATKYGSGWTGFSWNTELFPNPVEFMKKLHERGMKITLNLHPADGIRAYEDAYPQIAEHMKVDKNAEEPVLFDITNPEFLQYYYEDVLNPLEEDGVDFWWTDWQQGSHSRMKNLDPLWVLNHYTFLDNERDGKRGLHLSRYAGPGSHRYPVGFSGDTIISWESLKFQPYFTATASNVGYGWWSHDIGGHMFGYKDEELMTRWIQFGVFSPVMRLHSTNCSFNSKEPWRFGRETERIMTKFLQLRHRMLPYLYTMNHRSCEEDIPLILPLYYEHPEEEQAYIHGNEYYFGNELLVLPMTSKCVSGIHMAKENLWLPEGIWYDIFTNRVYKGGRNITVYRDKETLPVLAKEGTILPMTDQIENGSQNNPGQLHVYIYPGADGKFTLYEDDNLTHAYKDGRFAETEMELTKTPEGKMVFKICPQGKDFSVLPEQRSYVLEFAGCRKPVETFEVKCSSGETSWYYKDEKHTLCVEIQNRSVRENITVEFSEDILQIENQVEKEIFEFLDQAEMSYEEKERIYNEILKQRELSILISQLNAMEIDRDIMGVLLEILTAY